MGLRARRVQRARQRPWQRRRCRHTAPYTAAAVPTPLRAHVLGVGRPKLGIFVRLGVEEGGAEAGRALLALPHPLLLLLPQQVLVPQQAVLIS